MTTEDKLKQYILDRYKSIREFTIIADMSYSTLDSILRRGIGNSSVSNVIKICKILNISIDELANGNIVPLQANTSNFRSFEVDDILADVKAKLIHTDGLTIEGKPADKKSIDTIVNAIDVGEKIAKKQ